jgi:hypothetical protein
VRKKNKPNVNIEVVVNAKASGSGRQMAAPAARVIADSVPITSEPAATPVHVPAAPPPTAVAAATQPEPEPPAAPMVAQDMTKGETFAPDLGDESKVPPASTGTGPIPGDFFEMLSQDGRVDDSKFDKWKNAFVQAGIELKPGHTDTKGNFFKKVWKAAQMFEMPGGSLHQRAFQVACYMAGNFIKGRDTVIPNVDDPMAFPAGAYKHEHDATITSMWEAAGKCTYEGDTCVRDAEAGDHVLQADFILILNTEFPNQPVGEEFLKQVFSAASCALDISVEEEDMPEETMDRIGINDHCFKVASYAALEKQKFSQEMGITTP